MKKNKLKKLSAWLLALAMVATMAPALPTKAVDEISAFTAHICRYDDSNGVVSYKIQGNDEATLVNGEADITTGVTYEILMTEKPGFPMDFDWENGDWDAHGMRSGSAPVVYVRGNSEEGGYTNTYKVGNEEYDISDMGDDNENTWSLTWTPKAGESMEINWSEYDAFGFDDQTQFQIELVPDSDKGRTILTMANGKALPGDAKCEHEYYGKKYNINVADVADVRVKFEPLGGTLLNNIRINDVNCLVNAAAVNPGETPEQPTFETAEDGSYVMSLTADQIKRASVDEDGNVTYDKTEDGKDLYAHLQIDGIWREDDPGEGPGGPELADEYTIDLSKGTLNGKTLSFEVDGETVSITLPEDAVIADGKVTLKSDAELVVSDNFEFGRMTVVLEAEDGFQARLNVDEDYVTSILDADCMHLPDALLSLKIIEGGGNAGPEPSPNPYEEIYGDKHATATVIVEGGVDFAVNGVGPEDFSKTEHEIEYPYDVEMKEEDPVNIRINSLLNTRYTSLTINGKDYSSYIPGYNDGEKDENTRRWEVIEATTGQFVSFEVPVTYSETYTINGTVVGIGQEADDEFSKADPNPEEANIYWPTGNFLWSNMSNDKDSDMYMDHTTVEFVSFEYQDAAGETVVIDDVDKMDKGYLYFDNNVNVGSCVLVAGGKLTVRLIPKYGYQVVEFDASGSEIIPGDEVGVYTFEIQNGNLHLGAKCGPVADEIATTSKVVTAGDIEIDGNELDMGTARLSVSDAKVTDAEETAFAKNAGADYEVGACLELDMNQVVFKGSKNQVWAKDKSTLKKAAKVTLEVGELDGDSVEIVHQKHDGTYETIPATYSKKDQTVTFETDTFSKFAIATKAKAPETTAAQAATTTEAATTEAATTEVVKGDVVKDTKSNGEYEVADTTKKEVEYKAPEDKATKNVTIPDTIEVNGTTYKVTKIKDNAFKNNKKVTNVTVGMNVKSIGKNAFSGATNLKTVIVGKNVTKIGANAFKGCKKLKTLKITSKKLTKKSVANNAFKGLTKKTTIKVPNKILKTYKKLFKKKGLSSKVKVKGY